MSAVDSDAVERAVLSIGECQGPPAMVVVAMSRQTLSVDLDAVFGPEETTTVVISDDETGRLDVPGTRAPRRSVAAPRALWSTAVDDLAASARGRVEIVTNDEYCQDDVADLRARRGLARRLPSSHKRYLDKVVMKSALRDAGVPVTPFVSLDPVPGPEAAHEIGELLGPAVVFKPRAGANSQGITVTTSTDQTTRWLAEHATETGWLAECFLADPTHHANAIVVHGTVHDVQVGRYVTSLLDLDHGHPVGSHTLPEHHPASAAGRSLTRRVVRALGDDGVFVVHLEFFLADPPSSTDSTSVPAGAVVLEVAARAPGGLVSVMSGWTADVDLQRAHLRLQAGLPQVAPTPRPVYAGWLWYPRAADRPAQSFRPPDLASDHRVELRPHARPFSGRGLAVGASLLLWNGDHAAITSDMSRAGSAEVWS